MIELGLDPDFPTDALRQLEALGLVIKRGTLVDATIIAGAVRRPYEGGGVNRRDPTPVSRASATRPISATRRISRSIKVPV